MPISFTCPNPKCLSTMTVPDALAGKQGKCSKCKGPVIVPGSQANGVSSPAPSKSAAPPPLPGKAPAAPIDFEAEALAALSDAPTEAQKAADFIEFKCPQCDEPLKMALDLAGKRHPCPECRRIIAIPYPKAKDKANWRDTGPKLPTGAKRDVGPALEGAWGTDGRTGVSREALEEAGVIKEKEKPLTFAQKARPYVLVGVPVLVAGVGALLTWAWMARNQEKNALNYALKAASDPASSQLGPDALLALHGYAGMYFLKSNKPDARESAREQFGKAVALAGSTRSFASDAMLGDLVVAQLALGGTADDTPADRKRHWTETQKLVTAAVRKIDSQEGKLVALRRIVARLVDEGQIERVQPLVRALYPSTDADASEAWAVVGLELERQGKKAEATGALQDAIAPYEDKRKDRLPLRSSVVALATLMGRPAPAPRENDKEEKIKKDLGEIAALARQGKLAEARKLVTPDLSVADGTKQRYLITLAVAAAEAKQGTDDLQVALDAAKEFPRETLAWPMLRLIEACAQAGLPAEKVEPALAGFADPAANAWGKLLLLRARLASARSVESADLAEAIPANTLGGLVGRLELARHNTRIDSGWASKVKSWDDAARVLGSLGVALGMQKGK